MTIIRRTSLAIVVLSLVFGLFGQDASLESKVSQLEIGEATLAEVTRLLGEPERYQWGKDTFTRENLPARYAAVFPGGIRVVVSYGRVREMQFQKPGYRFAGRIQVGSPVAELAQVLGAKEIVKGPAPGRELITAGVLYEGGDGKQGVYARPDLGVVFILAGGRVATYALVERPGAEHSRGPADPCMVNPPPKGGSLKEYPRFDATVEHPTSPGVCGMNLAALDLRERAADLFKSNFSNKTTWPARDRLPEGFDPQRILDLGRNPGLGVRSLHKRGITGKGVSIALVDNPLLLTHKEYASRLRFHEYINATKDEPPHFHGSFVVSLAAGETAGVAPGADIYYVSSWAGIEDVGTTFVPRAKAFERLLEVNRTLPPGKKIRVISMSIGWRPNDHGAAEMDAAAKRAKDEGMLVITANLPQIHGFRFQGLGREPLADPDAFESYLPGEGWARQFYSGTAAPAFCSRRGIAALARLPARMMSTSSGASPV